MTLELNPASLDPSNQLLNQICKSNFTVFNNNLQLLGSLQVVQRLASELHSATLQLVFQNCVNGTVAGCYTGALTHNGDVSITVASTGTITKPCSFTGISIKLQVSCSLINLQQKLDSLLDHIMYIDTIKLKFDLHQLTLVEVLNMVVNHFFDCCSCRQPVTMDGPVQRKWLNSFTCCVQQISRLALSLDNSIEDCALQAFFLLLLFVTGNCHQEFAIFCMW